VQDDPRSGQPKMQRADANVDIAWVFVRSDRRLVVKLLAVECYGKWPELWPDRWILHDIAPAHDALRVHKFVAKKSITKLNHPSYSPDMAPCDYWHFPKFKKKCLARTKICWRSWHPTQYDITVRYSGKQFSRLFHP
jgi:hypothetical protein